MEEQLKESPLLVSIQCITYNHESYIRHCLDGFVMQKTNFRFEVIVHDDASTDNTVEIIRQYVEKYPDIIKPIYEKENQYSKIGFDGIFRIMNEHSKGKYIAICEGDDCWTDPYKLQKQVDFLESHPDYILSHSDIDHEFVGTGKIIHSLHKHYRNYNQLNKSWDKYKMVELILAGKYSVQTLSVCARKDDIIEIQNDQEIINAKLKMGDTPLWIELSQRGKFHYLKESTATYHIIAESATHSSNFSNVICFYESCFKMVDLFGKRYKLTKNVTNSIKQQYISFLLFDVYKTKRNFYNEVNEKIISGTKLSKGNSLLIKTLDYPTIIKTGIFYILKLYYRISHRIGFYKEKYLNWKSIKFFH